jgi:UDP-2,3-diacylglucosamine hydrolase
MTTLFISDLHLSNERPEKLAMFYEFIAGPAKQVESVYMLGDLFEYWVGDDDNTAPNTDILKALSELPAAGVDLFVMHGNRDFLMGKKFEKMTGAKLLPDPHVISLYGEKTLLMHGDLLCTKDVDYLNFRAMVRNPAWQEGFLAKPLSERLAIAQQLRAASKEAMQNKIPVIMDVEQITVEKTMREYQVNKLIHGHTHRPAVHEFSLDQVDHKPATRTVLGDWYQNENVLICDQNGQKMTSIQEVLKSQA